jgi:hypothetical protein
MSQPFTGRTDNHVEVGPPGYRSDSYQETLR